MVVYLLNNLKYYMMGIWRVCGGNSGIEICRGWWRYWGEKVWRKNIILTWDWPPRGCGDGPEMVGLDQDHCSRSRTHTSLLLIRDQWRAGGHGETKHTQWQIHTHNFQHCKTTKPDSFWNDFLSRHSHYNLPTLFPNTTTVLIPSVWTDVCQVVQL